MKTLGIVIILMSSISTHAMADAKYWECLKPNIQIIPMGGPHAQAGLNLGNRVVSDEIDKIQFGENPKGGEPYVLRLISGATVVDESNLLANREIYETYSNENLTVYRDTDQLSGNFLTIESHLEDRRVAARINTHFCAEIHGTMPVKNN